MGIYGLMAEFMEATDLLEAAQQAHDSGYVHMDAFSPFPIEGLSPLIGLRHTRLARVVLGGGLVGLLVGLGMQYYATVIDYPINVGGRPLASWPSYVPVTFEIIILFAAVAAVLGMLALTGLPMPYHPVFNVAAFKEATSDRFFLLIEAKDSQFDLEKTRAFLQELDPVDVHVVEP